MPEQLSFVGFDTGSQACDGAFFAIFPDADAAQRIAQLARRLRSEHGFKGAPLETNRFHVSLQGLSMYAGLPRGIIAAAREAAATIASPPFDVTFDRVVSFRGGKLERPLVLRGGDGLASLTAFQQALGAAMTKAGLGRWAKSHYAPHVTLLYDGRGVGEQAVGTIDWTVRKFVLVHSLLGQTRHIPLARWPLGG